MCLAVPMQVIEIKENTATVELAGTRRIARLDIIDPSPKIGDWVIVHAGFIIQTIDEQEAKITLNYFQEMLAYESETSE